MGKKSKKTEILLTRILQKQSNILWKGDIYRHKNRSNGPLRRKSIILGDYMNKHYWSLSKNSLHSYDKVRTRANNNLRDRYDLVEKNYIKYKNPIGNNYFIVQDEFARVSGVRLQIPHEDIRKKFIVCKIDSVIIDGLLNKATKQISIDLLTQKIIEMYGKEGKSSNSI